MESRVAALTWPKLVGWTQLPLGLDRRAFVKAVVIFYVFAVDVNNLYLSRGTRLVIGNTTKV